MVSFINVFNKKLIVQYNFTLFSVRVLLFAVFLSLLVLLNFPYSYLFLFNYVFYLDPFTYFIFILILVKFIFFLLLIENKFSLYNNNSNSTFLNFELVLLFLFAVLGMIGIICSNDFIVLYLCIELQSLSLYVLAASSKHIQTAVENSIKYFILGAFASSIFLFGFSILYGFLGVVSYDSIINYSIGNFDILNKNFSFFIIGFVLLFSGFLFKLAIFPFHQWLPDIYAGCDFLIVIFFAVVSKISIVYIFIKFLLVVFTDQFYFLNILLTFCCIFSILFGSVGALFQFNLRKLLAYSSIANMGYLLLILYINSLFSSLVGMLFYLNYVFCLVFVLIIFYLFDTKKVSSVDNIVVLTSYFKKDMFLSGLVVISLFSLFGMPPFVGFFTKFYMLLLLISQKYFFFFSIIFVVTILSVFYYFRVINYFFFNLNKFTKIGFINISELIGLFIFVMNLFIVGFIFSPEFFVSLVSGYSFFIYV